MYLWVRIKNKMEAHGLSLWCLSLLQEPRQMLMASQHSASLLAETCANTCAYYEQNKPWLERHFLPCLEPWSWWHFRGQKSENYCGSLVSSNYAEFIHEHAQQAVHKNKPLWFCRLHFLALDSPAAQLHLKYNHRHLCFLLFSELHRGHLSRC